jgi:hypothetical protein
VTVQHVVQVVFPIAVGAGCLWLGLKLGRRWRSRYKGALAYRAHLESEAAAAAALRAEINVRGGDQTVVIGDAALAGQLGVPQSDGSSLRSSGLVLPRAVGSGDHRRAAARTQLSREWVSRADDVGVPEFVERGDGPGDHRDGGDRGVPAGWPDGAGGLDGFRGEG